MSASRTEPQSADDSYSLFGAIRKSDTEAIQIGLSEYRGTPFVDIRIWAASDDRGHRIPSKRGVAFGLRRLDLVIKGLLALRDEARRRGLLDEEG